MKNAKITRELREHVTLTCPMSKHDEAFEYAKSQGFFITNSGPLPLGDTKYDRNKLRLVMWRPYERVPAECMYREDE